jgi:cobalt-zinc-cadmium efflux system outer membrane protein
VKSFVALLLLATSIRAETLEVLVNEALENNPEVAAAQKGWAAAKARVPQARSLDDPMVGVDVERMGTTRFDTFTDNEWMISQSLPWFGKRSLKGSIEAGTARKAAQLYRARALEVTAMVKQAYYDLWQAERELELNRRNQTLLQQFVDVATAKYEAGKSSQTDVLKAQTELSKLVEAQFDVTRNVEKARAELKQQVGRSVDSAEALPAPLLALSLEQALKTAAEQRPELMAVRQGELASAKASLELARKQYFPDFQFRIEARQYNGKNGIQEYDTGVFMNFPWLQIGKRNAAIREARLNVEQKEFDYETLKRRTEAAVKKLHDGMTTMHHHYELFADKIIPQQRAAVEAARTGYEADKTGFLDLLDAQRVLLDFEMQNLHHLAEFHRLTAELERLIGGELPRSEGD